MKIKLDENLPDCLCEAIQFLGHDVHTLIGEGFQGADDPTAWRVAKSENRFFITQDLDFSDIRQFAPGTHAGIMLIRLLAPSRRALRERIVAVFEKEDVETWKGCFVVITDHKA